MDFSTNIFHPPSMEPTISTDTIDHAKMVMACRFGWTASPCLHDEAGSGTLLTQPTTLQTSFSNTSNGPKSNRFTPCRGRLYHQLTCSHRIRTDIVDECGPNCLDPLIATSNTPFFCHECIETEACRIWNEREAQLNSTFPDLALMTKEQYEHWYAEYHQLESQHTKDRTTYELDLVGKTRPSNVCSAIEMSKEEMEFAAELDSLSLSMISTNHNTGVPPQARSNRISLPGDMSEQLHWGLNSLDLGRGSCGIEYANIQPTNGSLNTGQQMHRDELWGKSGK
jgi:hypothetical protein